MKTLSSFHLKIIALLTMIIDHLGMIFFENYSVFRIIGRIAFILYAFMLVEGFFHTKNFQKYLRKLFLWALISEIPFDLAGSGSWLNLKEQNIFFTLFLSVGCLYFLEKHKEWGLKILIILLFSFSALILRVDYYFYGIWVVLSFYFSKKYKFNFVIPILLLSVIIDYIIPFQSYAFLGLIPILMYNGQKGRKTGNIYYSFYAVHLLILAIIKFEILI